MHGDAVAFDRFDEADDCKVAFLIRLRLFGRGLVVEEFSLAVGQSDALSSLEVSRDESADAWDVLRVDCLCVQNVAEKKGAADEGADLDLNWARDLRGDVFGDNVGDDCLDLLTVQESVEREKLDEGRVKAINLHVLTAFS